ncbi:ABC transporter permease subunit [Mycoplasmopsis opalescens]|uniref:ABC transporter permease subunit n=1 Tax=Mycoplasmopsis opalescens TaxID=114886 RepID=UPI00068F83B3|nr:ABC transporter permease subunit [Mycoplasmopsis opalescens]
MHNFSNRHHPHLPQNNNKDKFHKSLFHLTTHEHNSNNFAFQKSTFKLFFNRFSNNKIAIIAVIISFLLSLFLILSAIFYRQPYNESVQNSFLFYNLPNASNPQTFQKFNYNDPMINFIVEHHKINNDIIKSLVQSNDQILITYDPYALIYSVFGKKVYYVFGTDANGFDLFSLFINSLGFSILITIIAGLIQLFIGAILGTYLGYFALKNISKLSSYLFNTVAIIPYLILAFLIFNYTGYSHVNAILILGLLGTISVFYSAFAYSNELKNKEFISSYIVSGLSNNRIIWKIIMPQILFKLLSVLTDNIALMLLTLAALAFFNIENIIKYANIGNVFKNVLDQLDNVVYTVFVISLTSLYIVLLKIIGLNLYVASIPVFGRKAGN